ncbi:MAG: hypothetical protein KKB20_09540, partial [Proteobacteria bacterium]|nr:hypothetical protein [Pseudomonadota bacterium]
MYDVFSVDIGVADVGKTRLEHIKATVDSGSTFTTVPHRVVQKLNLPFVRERKVETSDKRIIRKKL